MVAGLIVFNDDGIYQIDDTYKNVQLLTKGVVASMLYYDNAETGQYFYYADVTVALNLVNPVIAINGNPSNFIIAGFPEHQGGGTYKWRVFSNVNASFSWYVFDEPQSTVGFGMEVRNSSNQLKFVAGLLPFKPIVQITSTNANSPATTTLSSGRTYAVVTLAPGVNGIGDSSPGDICTGYGAYCSQRVWTGAFKVNNNVITSHIAAFMWQDLYISGGLFCGPNNGSVEQRLLVIDVTGA